ncbi:MAG: hypothetical protein BBJ57_02205 [Desulfobacterales bacterium PC51MH44]|nr:MAG: hypothetical protein BBJ57_02205 [Desulfobacterales bacterium PC51MH44]
MADYTATAYGIDGDNKYTDRTTAALTRNADPNKGQKCIRFAVAAENEIMGGEIWVNADTVVANADTFTITATTTA